MDGLVAQRTNPVIVALLVTLLIVFDLPVLLEPLISTVITVMARVGVVLDVMLLNVLLVMVFVGPEPDAPSALFQPAMIVEPFTVMFEKLFRLFTSVDPLTDPPALASKNVTVPPAPPLLNPVTIELLFTF